MEHFSRNSKKTSTRRWALTIESLPSSQGILAVGSPNGSPRPPRIVRAAAADVYKRQLQAVRNRDETNAAQTVEVSIQEALIATSLYDFVAFSYSGFVRERSGKQFHLGFPNLVTLPCADGYVGVHPGLPHQIIALLELVERSDLAGDPRFCDLSLIHI